MTRSRKFWARVFWRCRLRTAQPMQRFRNCEGSRGRARSKGAFVQAQNMKTRIYVNVLSDRQGRYRILA